MSTINQETLPTGEGALEDMRCPKCGHINKFEIEITTHAEVDKEGPDIDSVGNLHFDAHSFCLCLACQYAGRVADFYVDQFEVAKIDLYLGVDTSTLSDSTDFTSFYAKLVMNKELFNAVAKMINDVKTLGYMKVSKASNCIYWNNQDEYGFYKVSESIVVSEEEIYFSADISFNSHELVLKTLPMSHNDFLKLNESELNYVFHEVDHDALWSALVDDNDEKIDVTAFMLWLKENNIDELTASTQDLLHAYFQFKNM